MCALRLPKNKPTGRWAPVGELTNRRTVHQTWLVVSNHAAATVTGGYRYHRQRQAPAAHARDPAFQDQLMDRLAALTGVTLL